MNKFALSTGPLFLALTLPLFAQQAQEQEPASENPNFADQRDQPNPFLYPDNANIRLSGSVESVANDAFVLDFGNGTIIVEMDDGDRDADAYVLDMGDHVTVWGLVDDNLFETQTIEASSVYVQKLGTHFFSSSWDEENIDFITGSESEAFINVQGRVTQVNEGGFEIETGTRDLSINVEEMPYDPLDEEGYQQIKVGDIVSVSSAEVSSDFITEGELTAEAVLKIGMGG